jgi:hypothetical protein
MVTRLYESVLPNPAAVRVAGIQAAAETVDVARQREHNRRG